MANKNGKDETFVLAIDLPKAPKQAKNKQILFKKLLSLIEESEEQLPIEVKSYKRRRMIILESDEFVFVISFGKRGEIIRVNAFVHAPEETMTAANEVGNKVISYLNTILGEAVTGSNVSSHKTIEYSKEIVNLGRKLIGEPRIAKINEEVKQTLNPIGIFFTYKKNNRNFAFTTFSAEESSELLLSRTTYKDEIPFDLLRTEHEELTHPEGIIKKITEKEL